MKPLYHIGEATDDTVGKVCGEGISAMTNGRRGNKGPGCKPFAVEVISFTGEELDAILYRWSLVLWSRDGSGCKGGRFGVAFSLEGATGA